MSKYRKKPIVIEAFQMTKERRLDNSEWPEWLNEAWQLPVKAKGSMFSSADGCSDGTKYTSLFINTLEELFKIQWNDWIIRGIQGEIYPCKPDIFEATYESVDGNNAVPLIGQGN